jgi:D-3-phosphoglycerate dehydrogenase
MMKIIISEKMAEEGVEILRQNAEVDYRHDISREELLSVIDQYDALVVRSVTKVNEELISRGGPRLKVVGRAGNGVDNIDVPVCSRYGIIVINTPDSNTISAAEHSIALLLASIRKLPWANNTVKQGIWDRTPFRGMELYEKTVGIVGLGRIGSMVATRLRSFNMRVIAYDPYIADERFERLSVEKVDSLDDIARLSDIISVHTPRTEETMYMLNDDFFAKCKDGVRIVNCARGGIIAEAAIVNGIKSGKIASAGLDVYEKEPVDPANPLFQLEQVVCTPHLGADTDEAQRRVGEDIARQVLAALDGGLVPNIVNLPLILRDELNYLRPYITLCERLGQIYYQIHRDPVEKVELYYQGPLTKNETSLLDVGFLRGLLQPALGDRVNYVNARIMAEERDIAFLAAKKAESPKSYKNMITAKITSKSGVLQVSGVLSRARSPILVEINGLETEANLSGTVIMVENEDRPRMIGPVAMILGDQGINIASMKVARTEQGSDAVMLINVDDQVDEATLTSLGALDGIKQTPRLLKFN